MQQCEDGLGGLTRRMQSPPSPSRLAASVTVLESMIGRILMSYREVQLDLTPEVGALYMLFERCRTKNRMTSTG